MPIVVDHSPAKTKQPDNATIDDAIASVNSHLPPGRVIVKIELDGDLLNGQSLEKSARHAAG